MCSWHWCHVASQGTSQVRRSAAPRLNSADAATIAHGAASGRTAGHDAAWSATGSATYDAAADGWASWTGADGPASWWAAPAAHDAATSAAAAAAADAADAAASKINARIDDRACSSMNDCCWRYPWSRQDERWHVSSRAGERIDSARRMCATAALHRPLMIIPREKCTPLPRARFVC